MSKDIALRIKGTIPVKDRKEQKKIIELVQAIGLKAVRTNNGNGELALMIKTDPDSGIVYCKIPHGGARKERKLRALIATIRSKPGVTIESGTINFGHQGRQQTGPRPSHVNRRVAQVANHL